MIVCPACHAENPDGTKICVKCATELPKAAADKKTKAAPAAAVKSFGMRDFGRDMVDLLWLLLIMLFIGIGFWYVATNGTWRFTNVEEAKIVEPPVRVVKARAKAKRHIQVGTGETQTTAMVPEKPMVLKGSAETYYQKGKDQYDTKHYQTSFNYLRQALEVDPTYAKAYFGLGFIYSRFDMDDAAVRMYEMALRFDPSHVDSINNLAMMYYHAGNTEDALNLLQKAASLENQNADIQYNLGSILLEKNQTDSALQAFQKASMLRPNDASIYNNMALTYEKMAGKKQEAEDTWKKVMDLTTSPVLLQQAKTHLDFLKTQG